MLNLAVSTLGWHFQLEKPILEDLLAHLDHPYKQVREVIGTMLSTIFFIQFHESYPDVPALLKAQKDASSVGTQPYKPTEVYSRALTEALKKLEVWRKERTPGTQQPTPYTQAAKTVLTWLDATLFGPEARSLIGFLDGFFIESILNMMDIKEDPELQSLAYQVFRQLANIPLQRGEDNGFVQALIHIARTSAFWHQRLRVLINLQAIYFRQIFYMTRERASEILKCVREMLFDGQLEVRLGAAATISGMIRCSEHGFRDEEVSKMQEFFTKQLKENPLSKLPKRNPAVKLAKSGLAGSASSVLTERTLDKRFGDGSVSAKGPEGSLVVAHDSMSAQTSRSGTPTPEQNKLVLTRHAAVLGLGSLIQAFPYVSPPPKWLPEVLATLASKASADPGIVGKSVKTILSDFKKTRQDTWHVDVKVSNHLPSDI